MPRGAPDYSNVKVDQPLHRLTDLAELAARLGSPDVYDRAGNVVWMTNFDHGLQGTEFDVDPVASEGYVTAARSCHGAFSLLFDPSADEGSYVTWGRVVQFLLTGKVATEVVLSTDAYPGGVKLVMHYYTGERQLGAVVFYKLSNKAWYIQAKDLGWVKILESYEIQSGPTAWHHVKLVVDTKEKRYVRLLIDRKVVLLPEYELTDEPSEDLGQLEVRFEVYGEPAYHAPAYLDTVLVTQNEP